MVAYIAVAVNRLQNSPARRHRGKVKIMKAVDAIRDLRKQRDPVRAKSSVWFFKTGKGEYGEGDKFLGVTVPETRKVAKKYSELTIAEIEKILNSRWHEERLLALIILTIKFERVKTDGERKLIFDFYLAHARQINNWDLVDTSAPRIVGVYLRDKPRKVLYSLAKSPNLWERRIAIIATLALIQLGDTKDAVLLSEMLIGDNHDLMHKAVGWVLREAGKKSSDTLKNFLGVHLSAMSRTTLRYAIERLPERERKAYLSR